MYWNIKREWISEARITKPGHHPIWYWKDTVLVSNIYIYILMKTSRVWGGRCVGKRAIISWDKEQEIDWNIVMDWVAGWGIDISATTLSSWWHWGKFIVQCYCWGEWGMRNCPLPPHSIISSLHPKHLLPLFLLLENKGSQTVDAVSQVY